MTIEEAARTYYLWAKEYWGLRKVWPSSNCIIVEVNYRRHPVFTTQSKEWEEFPVIVIVKDNVLTASIDYDKILSDPEAEKNHYWNCFREV